MTFGEFFEFYVLSKVLLSMAGLAFLLLLLVVIWLAGFVGRSGEWLMKLVRRSQPTHKIEEEQMREEYDFREDIRRRDRE